MQVIFSTDSIQFPLTGIGRYAYELAKCLQKNSKISELLFLNGNYLSRQIPSVKEKTSAIYALRRLVQKSCFASQLYQVTAKFLKTHTIKKYPNAIYHSPNFYLPPNLNRCVATFHDLSVFTSPEYHPKERIRFMQKELLLTIKRADMLITDSEFTRLELAEYFNLPLRQVHAAKLGRSDDFYPREAEELNPLLAPFGLKANHYSLFIGSIEPRKNIATLLDAYERLPLALRLAIPLVISGFKGWSSAELHQRFERAKNAGWLHYLGYTQSAILPCLFAGARSFLFPSLYEGFGLPVLEAMASGTPVVCSNTSSLPEVAGDCALMCAPKDIDTLTLLIKKALKMTPGARRQNSKG